MKNLIKLALLFCLFLEAKSSQAQLGVGTITPDNSSILDLTSTTKGLLTPRMTSAQRSGIALPATGLLIFNATINAFEVNTGTPASPVWSALGTTAALWLASGNANTVDGTHFLGTTDDVPLNFKVNNQKAGRIDNTSSNAFFGYQAGNVNTGTLNTFNGHQAGYTNSTGSNGTAFGYYAGRSNTTGDNNTFIGWRAGYSATPANANTTGSSNTFIGYNTGPSSSTQLTNAAAIGAGATVGCNNCLVLGATDVFVGIGTANPTLKLHVQTATNSFGLYHTDGTNDVGTWVGTSVAGVTGGFIGTYSATPLSFFTNNSGALMLLSTAGNFGIGDITPTRKLDVEGDARIGVNGTTVTNIIKATVAKNVANVPSGSAVTETFAVANAALASSVIVSPATALANGLSISYARVSAAGTVEVKFYNSTLLGIDPANMNFYITVIE